MLQNIKEEEKEEKIWVSIQESVQKKMYLEFGVSVISHS